MLKDFKTFINRGNVLDLAVAVIIGAAFGKIVGDVDFSNYFVRLGPLPAGYTGSVDNYTELKKAGVSLLGYGSFITAAVNFVILAFVVFLIVRAATRVMEQPKVEEPAAEPTAILLLREIRDELRKRG